jgi:hypothetical protein
MKSFKQMVSEVAKPISPDEQRFIDQHTYEVQKHPVALDHQFTGDIAGKPSKTTEPDASTYDAAYAAKDPAVERIGEEVEQIDEISKDLAQRYYSKSQDSMRKSMNTMIDTEKARKPEKKKQYEPARKTFHKRAKGSDMAAKRLAYKGKNEEAEQIDEISRSMTPMKNKFGGRVDPKKFDAYKKYMKKNSLDEPTVRMIADNPDAGESKQMMNNPKYKEAMKLYRAAHIKEEVELTEDPTQEKPMMMGALRAMSHNMMGIAKYVQSTNDPEEWFQNKLAGVAKEMQTLYSYATAETMTGMATEETVNESQKASLAKKLAKVSASSEKGKKAVTLKKAPWEKKEETELTDEELSAKQKKIDHNKNGKIDGHDLAMLRNRKKVRKEEVEVTEELLDEAMKFKAGAMKLKDGSQVILKKEDADALTSMFKDLSRQNQKKLGEVAKKDKSGFEEILGFAREAL